MSEKRNAVILTGFMRDYEQTVGKLKKNLITDDSVDIFISAWTSRGHKKEINRTLKFDNGTIYRGSLNRVSEDSLIEPEELFKCYDPTVMSLHNYARFEEMILPYAKLVESSDILATNLPSKPKTYKTLMRRYGMFYMTFQGWRLMEIHAAKNDIQYQKVVKVRADFEKNGYYPKINWDDEIPPKLIKIGEWNLQQYPELDKRIKFDFQDHFAIGNYDDMHVYFNMFNNLHKLSRLFVYKTKQWHGEYCLSLWLTMNGIYCVPHNNKKKLRNWMLMSGLDIPESLEETPAVPLRDDQTDLLRNLMDRSRHDNPPPTPNQSKSLDAIQVISKQSTLKPTVEEATGSI